MVFSFTKNFKLFFIVDILILLKITICEGSHSSKPHQYFASYNTSLLNDDGVIVCFHSTDPEIVTQLGTEKGVRWEGQLLHGLNIQVQSCGLNLNKKEKEKVGLLGQSTIK